jgi:hypothetical protein
LRIGTLRAEEQPEFKAVKCIKDVDPSVRTLTTCISELIIEREDDKNFVVIVPDDKAQ